MAPTFLRRANDLTCFYCLSAPDPAPVDARAFRCPHCGCWNRYDANGDIVSDDPAMHDEKLNAASFAKRASPNKDRLPSVYTRGPFCRTCQTNQMLLVNLLSNYLPPPQHPDYPRRLEQLPAYRESLHVRYPPVCANCLPAVEDEIERKNQMARTKALGGWLKESKGRERLRLVSRSAKGRQGLVFHLWRARGALWGTTLFCVVVAYAAAVQGYDFPRPLARAVPMLPLLSLLSLFYAVWDPTYYHFERAKVQGRDVRVRGKSYYTILQALSWLSRFTTSVLLLLSRHSSSWDYLHVASYPSSHRVSTYCSVLLAIELLVLSSSFTILHLQRPPTIRLIGTPTRSSVSETLQSSGHSSARASPMPTAPVNDEPDLLASLTLSSSPLIPPIHPMFGQPSLASSIPGPAVSQASPIKVDEALDEDAMDWTPTNPSPAKVEQAVGDDGTWLRPQRFFPPERPTGLESLFANTKLDDGNAHATTSTSPARKGLYSATAVRRWKAITTVALLSLGTVVYHKWMKGWIW